MKKYYLIVASFIISCGFATGADKGTDKSGESGCGPLIEEEQPRTLVVPVTNYDQKIKETIEKLKSKATERVLEVKFDTTVAEEVIRKYGKMHGWPSDKLAEKLAELVKDAVAKLQKAKDEELPKLIAQIAETTAASLKEFQPYGKFQALFSYEEDCCDTGKWRAGACNPHKSCDLAGWGEVKLAFTAGVSIGAEISVDCAISVGVKMAVSIPSFNPVDPTTGSGNSIKINATPLWKGTIEGTASAGTSLTVSIGVSSGISDTLPDIIGTLKCK